MTSDEVDAIRKRLDDMSNWNASSKPCSPGECYYMARELLGEVARLRDGLRGLKRWSAYLEPGKNWVMWSDVAALLEDNHEHNG